MSIKLPLDEMTVQEKLAAMESLWEDLSRSPEAIESPAWHKDVLDHESAVNSMLDQVIAWGGALKTLREKQAHSAE